MDKSSENNTSAPSKECQRKFLAELAQRTSTAPMLAFFLYDCNNWSDRLVQLQNGVSEVKPSAKEQTEKDSKL
ncbi:unnamed protein product [Fusarium venenatum]|uniref:Uncharacterized protein n=1 Tax=Fusarium venenatum TaxID=56646 RepID=A0A2L2T2H2_9HYPO|nr:uncharacterized protein FVRRES_00360 [Fusarium venenatum]CEI63848.1 unnamed protein product [Fusarium venenatum]